MKILICGHRAYAARNMVALLVSAGYEVYCFSRGEVKREDNVITGPVVEMNKNPFLQDVDVDAIVNFILLDGDTVENNIAYIRSLYHYAIVHCVQKIVHLSSISVYSNDSNIITEETPVDPYPELKGEYGALKIHIDNELEKFKKEGKVKIVFIRPGFIIAPDKKDALVGIAQILLGHIALLMGDRKSTLPIVERDDMQMAVLKIIKDKNPMDTYILVNHGVHTKAEYLVLVNEKLKIISLSKNLVTLMACLLKKIGLFNERKYRIVRGLFKVQNFNAGKTYQRIGKRL